MTYVAYAKSHQIASAELAVDAEVEQCKLSQAFLHLQANSDCPDLFELERCFLTDELALVPCFVTLCGAT